MSGTSENTTHEARRHRHLPHLDTTTATPLVFITVTTHKRRRLLDRKEVLDELDVIWRRSSEHEGWFVGDYLLMPDHVHLFARGTCERKPMADWMRAWKSISSRAFKKMMGIIPPVWQADYFDRYLRSGESYSEKWQYVELNPVRAGLVEHAEDWPFKGRIHELRF